MNALLLTVSVFLNVVTAILRNSFCKTDVRSDADLHLFNAASAWISMAVLAVIGISHGGLTEPSAYTLGMGMLFGAATWLCALFNMKALTAGPLSYTNIIISCAMVVPALSGMALYGESVSAWQWVGIALMLVSIVCSVDRSDERKKGGTSLRWLLLCMISFMGNGAVGVMQKIHQSSPHRGELGIFLVLAFAVSGLISLGMVWKCARSGKAPRTVRLTGKRFGMFALITGAGVAACNHINMYLSGAMDAVVFYPVVNGAGMLLTALAGFILYKEKLTPRQWTGLCCGGAAILLLCGVL